MLTARLDAQNLAARTRLWARAVGVSLPQAMKYQGGLLIKDLVAGGAPKNLNLAQKRAELDVKKVLAAGPLKAFPASQRGGKSGMTWLYATPKILVGAHTVDVQPQMPVGQLRRALHESKNLARGKAFVELKTRGKQKVQRLNRIVVGRMKLAAVTRQVLSRFGLLKASWAVGWEALNVTGRLPAWVRRHVTSGAAKGVLINRLASEKPSLTLISRATGVERAASLRAIRAAVRHRTAAMLKDMKLYLNGTKKAAGFKIK